MIVKILRTTAVQGEVVTAGELVEMNEKDAKTLIAYGKAEAAEDPAGAPDDPEISTPDPTPVTRDPKGKK
jgi:hypothetical protein